MRAWFIEILRQMDMVELRRNRRRQLQAPRKPLVYDLEGFYLLPLFTDFGTLIPEELFVGRELYENLALEVFKT